MTITLTDLLLPLKKWWWFLLLAAVLAGGVSYLASRGQPPQYRSRAVLMIGQTIDNPNPSSVDLYLEQQLATAYANIGNREPVREAAKEALGLNWLPQYRVAALPNSQLIEVVVVDTIPERAQKVAREIADQIIKRSPSGTTSEVAERQEFIRTQLDTLEIQIKDTRDEINNLQNQLGELDSAREIQINQEQISALEDKLHTLQSDYAALLANTQQGAVNTLTIIEEPTIPTSPVGSNTLLPTVMAAVIGLSLAAAGVYLLAFLDKSVKTVEEIKQLVPAPVIGYIPEIPKNESASNYVSKQPRSPISDAFRSLRTNLDFVKTGKSIKTILVSGPMVADGKSTIAMNLARIIAQTDQKVILLDGDMRKSKICEAMGLGDKPGLSSLLSGNAELDEVLFTLEDTQNLSLITCGTIPPNPTELLESNRLPQVLAQLKARADVIIVDGPPFIIADAAILADHIDGIVMVVQLGHTHKDAIKAMMEQLKLIKPPLLGVVVNKYHSKPSYYHDYYHIPKETTQ